MCTCVLVLAPVQAGAEPPGRPQRGSQPPSQPPAYGRPVGRLGSSQPSFGSTLGAGTAGSPAIRGQSAPEQIPRMSEDLVSLGCQPRHVSNHVRSRQGQGQAQAVNCRCLAPRLDACHPVPHAFHGAQVTSLVAQSLDLPPGAAKWRHQQRKATAASKPRSSTFQLPAVSLVSSKSDSDEERDVPERPLDVRARAAGMLEKERDY